MEYQQTMQKSLPLPTCLQLLLGAYVMVSIEPYVYSSSEWCSAQRAGAPVLCRQSNSPGDIVYTTIWATLPHLLLFINRLRSGDKVWSGLASVLGATVCSHPSGDAVQ